MSNIKFDKWLNPDNTENYKCRAWVNFEGVTGSGDTIRASGNVSSVVRNATGDYTINFATAMPDANYAVNGFSGTQIFASSNVDRFMSVADLATNYVRVSNVNSANSARNALHASVAIFR
jgi:hypothetical protein